MTAKFEYGYAQFEPEGSADESESVIHAQLFYEFQARLQQAPEAALVGDWRCIISVARPFVVSFLIFKMPRPSKRARFLSDNNPKFSTFGTIFENNRYSNSRAIGD